MIHLFVNALAASAGGGLTYIRNFLPQLATLSGVRATVVVTAKLAAEFGPLPTIHLIEVDIPVGRRFWYEQSTLPRLIQRSRADVLLSTGNFALRKSPVPQILLSRNSIYTSPDFYRDLLSRHEYRLWLETRVRSVLARKSIRWANTTVAPSEAFARELTQWAGRQVVAVHHGFDYAEFTRDSSAFPAQAQDKLHISGNSIKLLFTSHYNYYRNFETLIRALPLVRERLVHRPVRLLLTCRLEGNTGTGGYRTDSAAKLVRDLSVRDVIVELGEIPYRQLYHLYAQADVYVTPAYTETFAHPLVEAMASGVPIVASDIPVHREICGDAAVYFPRFSPQALAESIAEVISSPEKSRLMSELGTSRSKQFSWKRHVEQILQLAARLLSVPRSTPL